MRSAAAAKDTKQTPSPIPPARPKAVVVGPPASAPVTELYGPQLCFHRMKLNLSCMRRLRMEFTNLVRDCERSTWFESCCLWESGSVDWADVRFSDTHRSEGSDWTGPYLMDWKVVLIGPEKTPYEGGRFVVRVRFPYEYPYKPPLFRLVTKVRRHITIQCFIA